MGQFSSLFEILAGFNLAYAGIKSFREVVINTLTDFYTPNDLAENRNYIDGRLNFLILNLNATSAFDDSLVKDIRQVKEKFEETQEEADKDHKNFLESSGFNPTFFIGFLFCFSTLIIIGYEQFFTSYSSIIAEQWLLGYGIYIVVLFIIDKIKDSYRKTYNFLCHHYVIFGWFITILFIAFAYSYCSWYAVEIPQFKKVVMSISLIIASAPFILEYFSVKKHAKNLTKRLKDNLFEAKTKIADFEQFIELSQKYRKK